MKELQQFTLRMPADLWRFIKITSAKGNLSMNDIIVEELQKYRKICKNKLPLDESVVS